jgi:hypothetical protein
MPFAQLTSELIEMIKACKTSGEALYRYYYKKDHCPIVITESVHNKYKDKINKRPIDQRSKSNAINKVERIVKKLQSNPDGTYIADCISLFDAIDFITGVIELIENNWLINDNNNGYLKISVDEEIMSCSSSDILTHNFCCYDLENELRFVIHKEKNTHPKERKNNNDVHPKTHDKNEEVHPEEKQRKTSMSKEEKESRIRELIVMVVGTHIRNFVKNSSTIKE